MGTIVVLDPIDLCSMSKHLFPKKYLLLCSTEGMSEKIPLTIRNITNQSFVFLRAWQYMWPLEDTTTPLRSGMLTPWPQLAATNIHLCFIGNKGKKYPPLQKKTQLLQYISPLGANCPCGLTSFFYRRRQLVWRPLL